MSGITRDQVEQVAAIPGIGISHLKWYQDDAGDTSIGRIGFAIGVCVAGLAFWSAVAWLLSKPLENMEPQTVWQSSASAQGL